MCHGILKHCITVKDWASLLEDSDGQTLNREDNTTIYEIVKWSLNAVRRIKTAYQMNGIMHARSQIFIITNEYTTETEKNSNVIAEVKALCKKYVDTKKMTVHIILLLGGDIRELEQLSSNIKFYMLDNWAYGLQTVKKFMENCMVEFHCAHPGSVIEITECVEVPAGMKRI